ncbi:MAG: YfiR family protein [Candidatus Aminicenantes bacterium]|nr:YfiR family protein [Candidatus Aminicenantes bacterium]
MNSKRKSGMHRQHGHGWWLRLLLLTSVLFFPFFPFHCLGQAAGGDLEAQVKAAYIYNFTKFIYWDKGANEAQTSPINIFVLGTDPIGGLLEDFSKKQTSSHPIIVNKIDAETKIFSSCQLFFIAQSEKQQLPSVLRQLHGTNVLTVSDISGFAHQGGMIGFVIEDGKVKIEINLQAVNNAGLKISAKLLEIAKIVSSED